MQTVTWNSCFSWGQHSPRRRICVLHCYICTGWWAHTAHSYLTDSGKGAIALMSCRLIMTSHSMLGMEMYFYSQFNIQCQTYLTNCSCFEVHGWKTFRFRVSSWFFLMLLSHSPYIFILTVSSLLGGLSVTSLTEIGYI